MSDNTETENISVLMKKIGKEAKSAQKHLAIAPTDIKNKALLRSAQALRQNQSLIISENFKDITFGKQKGLSGAMLDRLTLDKDRIEAMARGLEEVAALKDPVDAITDE